MLRIRELKESGDHHPGGIAPGHDLPSSLAERLESRFDWLLHRARHRLVDLRQAPLPVPCVRLFDHRLDAGRALPPRHHGESGIIELNAAYLRAHPDEMIGETLAHELAHLLVFHLHPRRRQPPHGAAWQQIMRDWFEVEPRRTHDFDASRIRARRQRRWHYRCGCQDHALTTVRHNRALRGTRYLCRACRGPLERHPDVAES